MENVYGALLLFITIEKSHSDVPGQFNPRQADVFMFSAPCVSSASFTASSSTRRVPGSSCSDTVLPSRGGIKGGCLG